MTARTGILLAGIVGAAVLAYQIGARLSDGAIMTLVGVMCGIAATIPISLGLLVALTRERTRYAESDGVDAEPATWVDPAPTSFNLPLPPIVPQPPPPAYPPIMLVAPPQGTPPPNYYPYYSPPGNVPPPPFERDFKIVGDEEEKD